MGINLKRDKLSFTKRETHVINMILNGYSIDEISRSLLISKKTVQSFVGIVLHKLNTTKISGIYRKKISSSTVLPGGACIVRMPYKLMICLWKVTISYIKFQLNLL
jgi:DNA-binding CsgD family transcriptional regulator